MDAAGYPIINDPTTFGEITISGTNASILSLEDGLVRAVALGRAAFTITGLNGEKKTFVVTVTEPHNKVRHDEVPSTCTVQGNTAYYECIDCGMFFNEVGESIEEGSWLLPLAEHTPMPVPAVPATTTETGLTRSISCGVCGEVLTAPIVTPVTVTDNVLILPVGTKALKDDAFNGVAAQRVVCPAEIESIGSGVFSGSSVTQIVILAADCDIAEDAFSGLAPEDTFFYVPADSAVEAWLLSHGWIVAE